MEKIEDNFQSELFPDQEIFHVKTQKPKRLHSEILKEITSPQEKPKPKHARKFSDRLYCERKAIDHQKWKKSIDWKTMDSPFSPSVNSSGQSRKGLQEVFLQSQLTKQHNLRLMAQKSYNAELKECTFTPSTNGYSGYRGTPVHLALYNASFKMMPAQVETPKPRRSSGRAFLARMEADKQRRAKQKASQEIYRDGKSINVSKSIKVTPKNKTVGDVVKSYPKTIKNTKDGNDSKDIKNEGLLLSSPTLQENDSRVEFIEIFNLLDDDLDGVIGPEHMDISSINLEAADFIAPVLGEIQHKGIQMRREEFIRRLEQLSK